MHPGTTSAATATPLPPFRADWAFFLDIDGTLLDYAPRPEEVRVDARIRSLVCGLQRSCGGALALVSGRAARDIDRLFEGLGIALAAQHGTERRDALGRVHLHRLPDGDLRAAARELERMAERHPGLVFEDKGLNLAMHYRLAPSLGAQVEQSLRALQQRLGPRFEVQGGKMLWEIKPSGRDKGMALAEFMQEAPFAGRTPVFMGDDVTDESAFQAVNRLGGHSIKVGPGESVANYRIAEPESVRRWLEAWIEWAARLQ